MAELRMTSPSRRLKFVRVRSLLYVRVKPTMCLMHEMMTCFEAWLQSAVHKTSSVERRGGEFHFLSPKTLA